MKALLALILILMGGCTATTMNAMSESKVTVNGDNIYRNGELYADLHYFMTYAGKNHHRGVIIHYQNDNKEIWIYPLGGWQISKGDKEYHTAREVEKYWKELDSLSDPHERQNYRLLLAGKKPTKSDFLSTWCFDIHISEDGNYVYYKTPGLLFDSSHEYVVE